MSFKIFIQRDVLQEIAGAKKEDIEEDCLPIGLKMPSKKDLESKGLSKLVRVIMNAGGFVSVAQNLGLKTNRRPNGYWEDLNNVDEVDIPSILP